MYGITFGNGRSSIAVTGFDYPTAIVALGVAVDRLEGRIAFDWEGRGGTNDVRADAFPMPGGADEGEWYRPTEAWIETADVDTTIAYAHLRSD